MRILAFGDIYGRVGRTSLIKNIGVLRNKYSPDLVLANVDNISSGRGAIQKHVIELHKSGVDYMFSGDHIVDNRKDIDTYLSSETSVLLRPANFYASPEHSYPGRGYLIIEQGGVKVLLIHLVGQVFMPYDVYNPFLMLRKILDETKGENISVVIVDFHRETTAEIYGMGHIFDGDISLIYGTHTHVQTNDEQILEKGTGFISDIGMTGPKHSVIGASIESVTPRFLSGISKGKIEQSLDSHYILSAIIADIDTNTGKTTYIEKFSFTDKL